MIDRHGFRSNVGIVLCNDEQQVFWASRVGGQGWQFPQGGIAEGESPRDAMYRELHEEVGLEPGDVAEMGRTKGWLRYRLPRQYRQTGRHPQCIGQKQIWYLLRLVADEDAVCLDSGDCPEFEDWRWVDYWRPQEEVVSFKRAVYGRALRELAPYIGIDNDSHLD
jgi:putative (di)nucleoside polyphosphate hydrolase